MASPALTMERPGILRYSKWDALLIALAAVHGVLVLAVPAAPVIALGLWWNSNTIAHYFIHKPFFRRRTLNVAFSLYLSMLLGIPQSLWRARHLAHHAGVAWRLRIHAQMLIEGLLVLALWATLAACAPLFLLKVYAPGWLAGLALCWLHGHYEHARGTTSHYGRLYNLIFLNDGYHVEHHAHPGVHWTRLPRWRQPGADTSGWPAILRWFDWVSLETLERCVLRSRLLQRFVLRCHERAFRALLRELPAVRRVAIVGGGLFPRTLLILQRLLPAARFVVIDRSATNIQTARALVQGEILFVHENYEPTLVDGLDLLVIPLSFIGDRQAIYRRPPVSAVIVHDWLWRPRGKSAVVSPFLLKRLNLVAPRIESLNVDPHDKPTQDARSHSADPAPATLEVPCSHEINRRQPGPPAGPDRRRSRRSPGGRR